MNNKDVIAEIKKLFIKLTSSEQKLLLQDLNNDSNKKTRHNLNISFAALKKKVEEEINDAIHNKYQPRDINNSTLNLIIGDAWDSNLPNDQIAKLEKLSYRGIIKWADEFGYLSDQDEDFANEHLEKFIELVKSNYGLTEQERIFLDEKKFLKSLKNFYSDYIFENFSILTGLPM